MRLRRTRILAVLALSLSLPACLAPMRAQETFTAADYYDLTADRLRLSVLEWKDRIAVAEKYPNDRSSYLAGLEAVTQRYQAIRAKLHGNYGISAAGYLRYPDGRQQHLASYLDTNAEVRRLIEDLSGQVRALVNRFESSAAAQKRGNDR